jgi:hypothetical protein
MSRQVQCEKCGNGLPAWGEDPMGLICNDCYSNLESQTQQSALQGEKVCINCLYWISADSVNGKCRNSFAPYYNGLTPVNETCHQFLSI